MDDFELGYRLGYAGGYDVGRGSVYHEIHEASFIHRFKAGPLDITQSELLRRRAELGEAHRAFTIRHGGPYRGGPVDWDTGRPA